ncbi:CCAP protein, partial [Biomphalaria glabrata]
IQATVAFRHSVYRAPSIHFSIMTYEHVSTTLDWLKLVTWLSLTMCTVFVHAEKPSQYLNQFPLTSTENVHSLADDQSPPRLQHLKTSMLDLFSPSPDLESNRALDSAPTTDGGFEKQKRVFCNSFTGCGGKFRGRRRRLKKTFGKRFLSERLAKRPFCNMHGCSNSGKRSGEVSYGDDALIGQLKFSDDELSSLKLNRQLCNSLGGCQNVAPRVGLLERLKQLDSDQTDSLGKRFYSGGFDEDADALAENMGR